MHQLEAKPDRPLHLTVVLGKLGTDTDDASTNGFERLQRLMQSFQLRHAVRSPVAAEPVQYERILTCETLELTAPAHRINELCWRKPDARGAHAGTNFARVKLRHMIIEDPPVFSGHGAGSEGLADLVQSGAEGAVFVHSDIVG